MKKKKILIPAVLLVVIIAIVVAILVLINKDDGIKGKEAKDMLVYNDMEPVYVDGVLSEKYMDYDFDADGLKNKEELEYKTDMYNYDTDNDGLNDAFEIRESNTDPLKYSSRDDEMSDMDYYVINRNEFEEGYYGDLSGYAVYLTKKEDRLYMITRSDNSAFDELATITEVFEIKDFSGKMALNCTAYTKDVTENIAIYKLSDGTAVKVDSVVTDSNLVEFEVVAGDVFCAVYEP